MPRTKVPKKNTAKRDRNSVAEEVQASLLRRLDEYNAEAMMDMKLNYEQRLESFADIMQNLRDSLPKCVMNMTMGELAKFNLADYNNSTIGGGADKSHKKIVTSRDDDGYITGESANSTATTNTTTGSRRPIGPLASAKGKSRRSRSAQNSSTISKPLGRSNSTVNSNVTHASRQKYRTPIAATNRIQTMSADRSQMMNPVTPKIAQNTPIQWLRYPKMGETVISLQGSPIVSGNVGRDGANINIPIGDNLLSMLPTANSIDFSIVSQIDSATLEQLRMLQKNLDIIVNKASAN